MGLANFLSNVILLGVGFYFTYTVLLPKLASLPQGVPYGGGGQFTQNATLSPAVLMGGTDPNGIKLPHRTTGKSVKMNVGGDPAGNGQRYNANHSFTNYLVTGYYKIGPNQELIEMKTDGPNHGGCKQLPKCVWLEPHFNVRTGKTELGGEWEHPVNHNNLPCPSCKDIPGKYNGRYIGYMVAAYQTGQYRTVEQYVDPVGLVGNRPANRWVLTLRETDRGQITNSKLATRPLPTGGKGLEAEIRMHGDTGKHGSTTDMKFGMIYEIVPPVGASALSRPTPASSGLGDININVNVLGMGNRVFTTETNYGSAIVQPPRPRIAKSRQFNNYKPGYQPSIVDNLFEKIVSDDQPLNRGRRYNLNQPILIRRRR